MPRSVPLAIEWPNHDGVSPLSEIQGYTEVGTDAERAIRRAEIYLRIKLARDGGLYPPRLVDEIVSNSEVWEIRWDTNDRHLRLYHGEPQAFPDNLVPLRFHVKSTDGSDAEIGEAQQAEINTAIERYDKWRPLNWFITP